MLITKKKRDQLEVQKKKLALLKNEKTVTLDGKQFEVAANIGTPNDVESVIDNGGEGVGLYRTEFLYMERDHFLQKKSNFKLIKQVLENMGEKPVVVRTLDIGGDKQLPYLDLPKEMNPFLGFRAIRLCLAEQELFPCTVTCIASCKCIWKLKNYVPNDCNIGRIP